ncbi:biotin carboxylase [Klebsormidium nitens]|uniref:Biotin carboxylase n=1 Tax=Klebsormidium nitens TaxID=105231 RepID=A0A1Y1IRJ3_KLENI|nr:biotin carboxylase [Klebsormidium nitens]|eukprot:GAQ93313.1 biotin carboxylase [Klebsormidium nitens]
MAARLPCPPFSPPGLSSRITPCQPGSLPPPRHGVPSFGRGAPPPLPLPVLPCPSLPSSPGPFFRCPADPCVCPRALLIPVRPDLARPPPPQHLCAIVRPLSATGGLLFPSVPCPPKGGPEASVALPLLACVRLFRCLACNPRPHIASLVPATSDRPSLGPPLPLPATSLHLPVPPHRILRGFTHCSTRPPLFLLMARPAVQLIVWAPTREKAIQRMQRALGDTVIEGVPTTIDYHKLILDVKDFKAGKVDTAFIPKHEDELATPPPPPTKKKTKTAAKRKA